MSLAVWFRRATGQSSLIVSARSTRCAPVLVTAPGKRPRHAVRCERSTKITHIGIYISVWYSRELGLCRVSFLLHRIRRSHIWTAGWYDVERSDGGGAMDAPHAIKCQWCHASLARPCIQNNWCSKHDERDVLEPFIISKHR